MGFERGVVAPFGDVAAHIVQAVTVVSAVGDCAVVKYDGWSLDQWTGEGGNRNVKAARAELFAAEWLSVIPSINLLLASHSLMIRAYCWRLESLPCGPM